MVGLQVDELLVIYQGLCEHLSSLVEVLAQIFMLRIDHLLEQSPVEAVEVVALHHELPAIQQRTMPCDGVSDVLCRQNPAGLVQVRYGHRVAAVLVDFHVHLRDKRLRRAVAT